MKFYRQIETSLKKLDSIEEVVPFKDVDKVRSGLSKKYDDLKEYTFGIELEFRPEGASDVDEDKLWYELNNNDDVRSEFIKWREEHNEEDNKHWDGNKDTWDDEYGPLPVYIWDDHNPEPELEDYHDEDDHYDSLQKWKRDRLDVEKTYENYTNWDDWFNEYLHELLREDEWETYISRDDVTNSSEENVNELIEVAKEYIIYKLDEDVSDDGEAEKDLWGVGEDETGVVEIRSRHLTQNDFEIVKRIVDYVSHFELGGDLSAHVHIGLPESFDLFDLLAITTLVDEKSIENIGDNRNFFMFSALRQKLHREIIKLVRQSDVFISSETYSFTMTFDELETTLQKTGRNFGTNIASMRNNKTIEFRYFSSEMAKDVNRFIEWIKYFLLLPKIAESRNRILLSAGKYVYDDKLLAIRDGSDQIKFVLYRDKNPKFGSHNISAANLKKDSGIYRTGKELASKLKIRKQKQQMYNYIKRMTYDREKVMRNGMSEKYIGAIDALDFSNTELAHLPDNLLCVMHTCNVIGTKLTSLNNLRWIGYAGVGGEKRSGTLSISNTNIKELPKGLHIANNLYADQTPLITLPSDIDVGYDISLRGSNIQYLPPISVFGFLALDSSDIHTFDPNIKVGGNLYIGNTPILDNILKKHPKLTQYLGNPNDSFDERKNKHRMFSEIVRPLYFPNVDGRIETAYVPYTGNAIPPRG